MCVSGVIMYMSACELPATCTHTPAAPNHLVELSVSCCGFCENLKVLHAGSLTVTQARSATYNSMQLEQIRGAVEMRLAKTAVSFYLQTKKYRI